MARRDETLQTTNFASAVGDLVGDGCGIDDQRR
jgi:hypothetical protein